MARLSLNSNTLSPNLLADDLIFRFPPLSTATDGANASETLNGNFRNNPIYAFGGDDVVNGFFSNDYFGDYDIDGGAGNDTLIGGAGNDTMSGHDGNDVMSGGYGNDILYGGAGNDTMSGGAGNDTLVGGSGADWIDGGAGEDTVDYSSSFDGVAVDLDAGYGYVSVANDDTLLNVENVVGTYFDDIITGSSTGNTIYGGDGDDQITGNGGANVLHGGAGNDYLDGWHNSYSSSEGSILYGGDGNDTILGGLRDDVIVGGSGDDSIVPNSGSDFIMTGTGHDSIEWQIDAPLLGNDVVTDFDPLNDALTFYDSLDGNKADFNVGSSADGDVQFTFGTFGADGTVELNGVQNQGWSSVQDLQNAGWDVTLLQPDP